MPNTCKSSGNTSGDERRTAEEHVGTCPELRDKREKLRLIPDSPRTFLVSNNSKYLRSKKCGVKIYRFGRGLRRIMLVGEVTAHQGFDAYLA